MKKFLYNYVSDNINATLIPFKEEDVRYSLYVRDYEIYYKLETKSDIYYIDQEHLFSYLYEKIINLENKIIYLKK